MSMNSDGLVKVLGLTAFRFKFFKLVTKTKKIMNPSA